jgi:hypothetical protein
LKQNLWRGIAANIAKLPEFLFVAAPGGDPSIDHTYEIDRALAFHVEPLRRFRGAADRGQYRQAAGHVAETLTRRERGNIWDGGWFY